MALCPLKVLKIGLFEGNLVELEMCISYETSFKSGHFCMSAVARDGDQNMHFASDILQI